MLTEEVDADAGDALGADDLPASCLKFGQLSKAGMRELIEHLDPRFRKEFLNVQERAKPGFLLATFHALTGLGKNYQLPCRSLGRLKVIMARWKAKVALAPLPAPPVTDSLPYELEIYKFVVPSSGPDEAGVMTYTHIEHAGKHRKMIPESLLVTNKNGWEFRNVSDHFGAFICTNNGVLSLPMGTLFCEVLQDYMPDAFAGWVAEQP